MVLADYFLSPLGLVALVSVAPLVLLYLLRPKPSRLAVPTLAFLRAEAAGTQRNRVINRLTRNLLLLLQLLVLVLLAVSLAAPYVPVSSTVAVDETVLVVDASASMATESGGSTRFDRAVAAARDAVTATTSIVVDDATGRVLLQRGTAAQAREALSSLPRTDTPGGLRAAINRATSIAGDDARLVVLSDFADEGEWETAVAAARAEGLRVELQQFDGGGRENVGIVDLAFGRASVTATVANTGEAAASRTLTLGDRSQSLELEPGDVTTATFDVPAGGGQLVLSPGDSFPVDDVAPVTAPETAQIRVLLLTNDENRYLRTALEVIPEVDLTVEELPAAVTPEYDVVIFSNVDPERLLQGNLGVARDVLEGGGGVAVQAQPNLGAVGYGDLLAVSPRGLENTSAVTTTGSDPITEGIAFTPPDRHVEAELTEGRTLLVASDGSPLLATAQVDGGRLLYYGFVEDASQFKFDFRYPVFWKRAVYYLAGRESLSATNRRTGERLQVPPDATVETPTGPRSGPSVLLDRVGPYTADDRRVGAALRSQPESDVHTQPLNATSDPVIAGTRETEETVPFELTPIVVVGAFALVLLEVGFLRYRGDV